MAHASDPSVQAQLASLRPRLHRYCARMVGSSVDGEDLVQETIIKALDALGDGHDVQHMQAWLFRIGHNTCLDFIRARHRSQVVPMTDDIEGEQAPDPGIVSVSFTTLMKLPELQRCAVVLKDVLGHSIEEVAEIADTTLASAKSALQRGRASLKKLAADPPDIQLPLMSNNDRDKLATYVSHFKNGEFDAIRDMLANDVKLDLVNRASLQGKDKVGVYFTRYAQEPRWRYALGAVEGRPAMLVFDTQAPQQHPAHWAYLDFSEGRVSGIRDYLFAPYAIECALWTYIGQANRPL